MLDANPQISQELDGKEVDSGAFDVDSCRKRWTLLDYDEYEQRKRIARELVVTRAVRFHLCSDVNHDTYHQQPRNPTQLQDVEASVMIPTEDPEEGAKAAETTDLVFRVPESTGDGEDESSPAKVTTRSSLHGSLPGQQAPQEVSLYLAARASLTGTKVLESRDAPADIQTPPVSSQDLGGDLLPAVATSHVDTLATLEQEQQSSSESDDEDQQDDGQVMEEEPASKDSVSGLSLNRKNDFEEKVKEENLERSDFTIFTHDLKSQCEGFYNDVRSKLPSLNVTCRSPLKGIDSCDSNTMQFLLSFFLAPSFASKFPPPSFKALLASTPAEPHSSPLVDPKTGEYVGEIRSGPLLPKAVDPPSPYRPSPHMEKQPPEPPLPSEPEAVESRGQEDRTSVREESSRQFVSVEQKMEEAMKLSQQGKHAEAIKHFSVAIQHCPPGQILTSLLAGRGKCQLEERMYNEGVEDLERALRMDPSSVEIRLQLAIGLRFLHKYTESQQHVKEVLAVEPRNNLAKLEERRLQQRIALESGQDLDSWRSRTSVIATAKEIQAKAEQTISESREKTESAIYRLKEKEFEESFLQEIDSLRRQQEAQLEAQHREVILDTHLNGIDVDDLLKSVMQTSDPAVHAAEDNNNEESKRSETVKSEKDEVTNTGDEEGKSEKKTESEKWREDSKASDQVSIPASTAERVQPVESGSVASKLRSFRQNASSRTNQSRMKESKTGAGEEEESAAKTIDVPPAVKEQDTGEITNKRMARFTMHDESEEEEEEEEDWMHQRASIKERAQPPAKEESTKKEMKAWLESRSEEDRRLFEMRKKAKEEERKLNELKEQHKLMQERELNRKKMEREERLRQVISNIEGSKATSDTSDANMSPGTEETQGQGQGSSGQVPDHAASPLKSVTTSTPADEIEMAEERTRGDVQGPDRSGWIPSLPDELQR
eukprot:753201-Hanusia_phi.AAC.7